MINMQSMDNICFTWSVVAALYPTRNNTDRTSSYPHYTIKSILNLMDIMFPITLNQIRKFENQNNISINVYCIEEQKEILPLRLTDRKRGKHINLLYVQDPYDNTCNILQCMDQRCILPCEIANYSNEE